MNTKKAIEFLDKQIINPFLGLPEDIFFFVSRTTPLVNVDLLIKDENGRMLLSWRDDKFVGKGWHVPGGIVRFKEKLETRIAEVAKKEIGTRVKCNNIPVAINQIICKHNTRGHFISILYKCFLSSKFTPQNKGLSKKDRGYLQWHTTFPNNMIKIHKIYIKYT